MTIYSAILKLAIMAIILFVGNLVVNYKDNEYLFKSAKEKMFSKEKIDLESPLKPDEIRYFPCRSKGTKKFCEIKAIYSLPENGKVQISVAKRKIGSTCVEGDSWELVDMKIKDKTEDKTEDKTQDNIEQDPHKKRKERRWAGVMVDKGCRALFKIARVK